MFDKSFDEWLTRYNSKKYKPIRIGTVIIFSRLEYKYLKLKNDIADYDFKTTYYTGIITKQMFPGYQCKGTNDTILRYNIIDVDDYRHGWIIEASDIKEVTDIIIPKLELDKIIKINTLERRGF